MTFILTNDDGIDAPGLTTLRQALTQVTDAPQKVVAPKAAWSGCGHKVTLEQRIHVERRSDTEAAVWTARRQIVCVWHCGFYTLVLTWCCPASMGAIISDRISILQEQLPQHGKPRYSASRR